MTSTGSACADYTKWPLSAQVLIFILMFIGASALSTGGGIKVARWIYIIKFLKRELKKIDYDIRYKEKQIRKIRYSSSLSSDEKRIKIRRLQREISNK